MKKIFIFALFLSGCLLLSKSVAKGGDLFNLVEPPENKFILHINGYAFHFSREDQNENTLGSGFSYLLGHIKSENGLLADSVLAFETDVYKDSSSNVGYAAGFSWQNNLIQPINWGLKAGLVHQDQQEDDSGMYLIPYILPFIESHWDIPFNLRVTLVPPIGLTDGLLAFQLMVNFD